MKTFKRTAAQGDLYFTRVKALPKGTVVVPPTGGRVIVDHSESGHHHVMEAEHVTMHKLPDEIMECFLVVNAPTALRHEKDSVDRHEDLGFEPGIYKARRGREWIPEGWRMSND